MPLNASTKTWLQRAAIIAATAAICAQQGERIAREKLDLALRRGNWRVVDRYRGWHVRADVTALRTGFMRAIASGDVARVKRLAHEFPNFRLEPFVRQQVEAINSSLSMDPLAPPAENGIYSPATLEALLNLGANPNATMQPGEGDPKRTVLGRLIAGRREITDPADLRTNYEMERILRRHGAVMSAADAARFGDSHQLRLLLKSGANPNARDWLDRPIIVLAAAAGQMETTALLLEYGADPDSVGLVNPAGWRDTPLMVSEQMGHSRLAEMLVMHGARVNAASRSARGFTAAPLIPAGAFANVEHIRFLLSHGASALTAVSSGITPTITACERPMPVRLGRRIHDAPIDSEHEKSAVQSVKLLIKSGSPVNAADGNGQTPLMAATWSTKLTTELLAHGANINSIDNSGATPIMYALRRRNLGTACILIEHGADLNHVDGAGNSVLGVAAASFGYDSGSAASLITLMRSHGSRLLLREALLYGDLEEVNRILDAGTSARGTTEHGVPLLLTAAHGGHLPVVKALLDRGAEINATDRRGWSALMVAAGDGNLPVARLLLERGARTDLASVAGTTVHRLAERHYNSGLRPLLEARAEVPANIRL